MTATDHLATGTRYREGQSGGTGTGIQAQKKEPGCQLVTSGLPEGRRLPTLPTGGSVPSAMAGLTALFGMDRGGSPPQWPPSITLGENQQDSDAK